MVTYAATVTLAPENVAAQRIASSPGLKVLFGLVDVKTYSTTNAEITAITQHFSNTSPHVVIDGVSDNGFMGIWDQTTGTIKCFALQATLSATASATALSECVDNLDAGVFNFIAIGLG